MMGSWYHLFPQTIACITDTLDLLGPYKWFRRCLGRLKRRLHKPVHKLKKPTDLKMVCLTFKWHLIFHVWYLTLQMSLYGAEPLFSLENVLFTVEPHTTNLLCNEVLDKTNDFLYPSNSKIYELRNLVIANKFCQSLGPLLYRRSTVKVHCSLKTPWHRPSMEVSPSGLWAPAF